LRVPAELADTHREADPVAGFRIDDEHWPILTEQGAEE
jgi:hypothetical protein